MTARAPGRPSAAERLLRRTVAANNDRLRRSEVGQGLANPRALRGFAWNDRLEAGHAEVRAEWDRFTADGGRLPRIEEVIGEDQGNEGAWRAGILVSRGRPATDLAERFPTTLGLLADVPGLWSALWSVLEPGTELLEHVGPNAGVLRYHLGVRCGPASGLRVGDVTVPYRDGCGILFDDTVPHEAWNRGDEPRVTLFLEVLRPAPGLRGTANRAVQHLLALDPRYRRAPARADAWHHALNG